MLSKTAFKRYISVLVLFYLFPVAVFANVVAGFTVSQSGGCAPLMVTFTNTSTGTSATATYEWNFGNGHTSVLKDAAAIFEQEKTYTVTLTVKDGAFTSVKTQSITVYKKPEVAFKASIDKGCAPLPITFTASANAGSGNIASYLWDYGDGHTTTASQSQSIHTYETVQQTAVSLTVTNSFGCATTIVQKDVVDVKPRLEVAFEADKTVLCNETDAVQFSNTSSGPGTLIYTWQFGDGNTSSEKSPSYKFNKKGAYSVGLKVTSSEGCTAEKEVTNYLNVANYKTDFTVPDLVCRGSNIQFENKSTSGASNTTWELDGQQMYAYDPHLYYRFFGMGTHTVKLTNTYGSCIDAVSKEVEITQSPHVEGFVAEIKDICGAPTEIQFKDTTKGAIAWAWNFDWYSGSTTESSQEQAPLKMFTGNRYYQVQLTVTNAAGCSSQTLQHFDLARPSATIYANRPFDDRSCGRYVVDFYAYTYLLIQSYEWDFGDGTTSTSPTPQHIYTQPGEYAVKLRYKVYGGCIATSTHTIVVKKDVHADFEVSKTTTCGREPVTFRTKSTGHDIEWYNWFVNDIYVGSGGEMSYRFQEPGKYSIKHIVFNNSCHDTLVKEELITVLPPVTKMNGYTNTCEGTRGEITLHQSSSGATQWLWNFGDGQTLLLTDNQPQVKHTYTKSGQYKVVLTTTNGECSDKDSIDVHVLLKQKPQLTASKAEICADESLDIKVDNLERNTAVFLSSMMPDYLMVKMEYGDGTPYTGYYPYSGYWHTTLTGFDGGQENLRVILQPYLYNCYDTTDYLPLKIKGANAGFTIENNGVCFNNPVVFKDASTSQNSAIKQWEWNFGDGQTATSATTGNVQHTYVNPGSYNAVLKVTDASGCSATTSTSFQSATVSGPKAAFTASGTDVPLNTTVHFYNQTNNYGNYNTRYIWTFGDGTSSTDFNPEHTFTKAGTYTVKLTATDAITQCSSEITQVIRVRNFNTAFNFNTAYIGSQSCPPVLVSFTNTSQNYTSVTWDFGDGTIAGNVNYPTHIYTKPGTYIVTLYVNAANGITGKIIDSVKINEPVTQVAADLIRACTAQGVTLRAAAQNVSNYFWDFGDGTVKQSTDTFTMHHYQQPGSYAPKLMVKDANGCGVVQSMNDKIIIDALQAAMPKLPATMCTPKDVLFTPAINLTTGDGTAQALTYHWNFGTGAAKDTANVQNPAFSFLQPGTFDVSLRVQSPSGCVQNVSSTLTAFQGLGGKITGPAELCQQATAQFTGSTLLPGQPKWEWIFHDGTKVKAQNAPAKAYNNAGTYDVKLVVDNGGCIDTVVHQLLVNPTPTAQLSHAEVNVCLGSPVTLTASGGATYNWSPAAGLSTSTGASVQASPTTNTTYTVTVTSNKGCTNTNSVTAKVIRPMQVQLPASLSVCSGSSLLLQASGMAAYKWIGVTTGLSNTNIPNPVANPATTMQYIVVGTDAYQCFNDTAEVNVTVHPLPTVNAGPDVELLTGSPYQFAPVVSADVISYNWTPNNYLSCSNCATPEARPMQPMEYILTVTNVAGCKASDAVSVQLLCSESRVHIPDAFSPNNDGKNDVFTIKGQGIRNVKYLRIYNRWGELVFERSNFEVGDVNSAWNGKFKGQIVPSGSYVYFAEMSCNEQTFTRKGTVTVVY